MFVEKVGISEMDTIVAATSNGAKVLRVYDKTGSLEAGKSADLLSTYGSVYTFAWGSVRSRHPDEHHPLPDMEVRHAHHRRHRHSAGARACLPAHLWHHDLLLHLPSSA